MLVEALQTVLAFLAAHPYALIFVGLIFAGEVVLLPAIYLAVTGRLHAELVFLAAIAGMTLSDLAWFYLGRWAPRAWLDRVAGGRVGRAMERMERVFVGRGPQILVASKFVYGTRTAVQVLSGTHAMPLRVYLIANTLGVFLLVGVLFSIGYLVRPTVGRLGELVGTMEIAFLVFVVAAVLVHLSIARLVRARWSR